jgi:hypothetical protein
MAHKSLILFFVSPPLSCPLALLGRPVRAPRDRWSAWWPDIASELDCVRQSIFEHAEIDAAPSKVSDASAPKRPSTCGAWMRLIFWVSSIEGPCSGFSRRRSRVRVRFSRVHLAQKWAPERTPSSGFSFPSDDDEEFRGGRGKRVNRPPPAAKTAILCAKLRFATISYSRR